MYERLKWRNIKIMEAIIEKAERVCPGSLAMIGVYGSFLTEDLHEKSDLDLMIVINDDAGWQLSSTFIQDDLEVGHDLYCTTWESLEADANYEHPYISKMMDAMVVYFADESYVERLERLRKKVTDVLEAPLSIEDVSKVKEFMKGAVRACDLCVNTASMSDVRYQAACVIDCVEKSVAMMNKKYFQFGIRRVFDEMENMELKPDKLKEMIMRIVQAKKNEQILSSVRTLTDAIIKDYVGDESYEQLLEQLNEEKKTCVESHNKEKATADTIGGTYEEMFSNWRNKMYVAAGQGDHHLALMSLYQMQGMLNDLNEFIDIPLYDAIACYDPEDLQATAVSVDALLANYLTEYDKIGLEVNHYPTANVFIEAYLK